ncbi:MAG: heat-inducible transcriptional repressor HrcA [Elusimicrobia bacterium]|nr:heat-inducible transcriptional repressor HrcA [Elusimicrobiota bacterium]
MLKPQDAKEREQKILRWIIEEFVVSRRPVSSELVAQKARLNLSSATIRNVMKKLEEDGFLAQSHISGGRIPTDAAYRFYVDYIADVQKFAVKEREKIEGMYHSEMEEVDQLMIQTSRMLAAMSKSAGFVYSANLCGQCVRRLDFIPLGPGYMLAVLVTESGSVHHWPISVAQHVSPERIRILGSFINEQIEGLPLEDAKRKLWEYLSSGHSEIADVAELAKQLLEDIERHETRSDDLYLEGISHLAEESDDRHDELCRMLSIVDEKRRFAEMLDEKLKHDTQKVTVSIGSENEMRELRNLSIVTSTYKLGDRAVGMLGILGPRHMEYPRMISLVNFMSDLMETALGRWEKIMAPDGILENEPQRKKRKQQ